MLGTAEIYLIIINTIAFIFNSLNIFLNKRQSYKINILYLLAFIKDKYSFVEFFDYFLRIHSLIA